MNCSAGDMALIVRQAGPQDLGRTVICIRLLEPSEFKSTRHPIWLIDRFVTWAHVRYFSDGSRTIERQELPYIPDACLMPIRPQRDEGEESRDERRTESLA